MSSAILIGRRAVAAAMLLGLLSLLGVNSVLACSVDPDSHVCCRRAAGQHPCDVPDSPNAYPLLVAVALDHQDFTPAMEAVTFAALPEPVTAEFALAVEVSEFDTGPPGPLFSILRI